MDAPVGVLTEEAGDAGRICAPHHVQSIPARAAGGNRGAGIRSAGTPAQAVPALLAKRRTAKVPVPPQSLSHYQTSACVDSGVCATLLCPWVFLVLALLTVRFRDFRSEER